MFTPRASDDTAPRTPLRTKVIADSTAAALNPP
jgi:hypothetical protein